MKGKIVKISSNVGFIEYADDNRISYVFKDYKDFKIGDEVNFELISKSVAGTDQTFNKATNLKSIRLPTHNQQ